jgi:hypothetical protein
MMKKQKEATIDGRPISEIITMGQDAYEYIDKPSAAYVSRLKRFTAFVGYDPYDPGDGENGPRIHWRSIEEIDVNAQDETEARIIAELALMWHYDEGGHIAAVEERFGLYF